MKSTLPLILLLLIFHNSHAIRPAKVIHSYKISLSSSQDLPVLGYATLKLDLVKGKKRKEKEIEGEVTGTRFWKKFDIRSSNGVVREGLLFPDFETLPDSGNITLHVKSRYYRGKEKTFRLKLPVLAKIEILPERENQYGQGSELRFDIKGIFSDGSSYLLSDVTEFYGFRKSDFQVIVNRHLTPDFSYVIPYMSAHENKIIIEVTHKKRDIAVSYHIIIDHKVSYSGMFAGRKGYDGHEGQSPSSTTGCNGRNGGCGSNGLNGDDGNTLMIYARFYQLDSFSIIKIKVKDAEEFKYYTLNCNGGQLRIELQGGNGGNGGNGGRGGNAYTRNSSETVYGGSGGNGGNGGNGGRGGNVIVFTDSLSIACIKKILDIHNPGGQAGDGGSRGARGQGQGPSDNNQSFLSLLLTGGSYSGSRGNNGSDGYPGSNGKQTVYEIIPSAELDKILD